MASDIEHTTPTEDGRLDNQSTNIVGIGDKKHTHESKYLQESSDAIEKVNLHHEETLPEKTKVNTPETLQTTTSNDQQSTGQVHNVENESKMRTVNSNASSTSTNSQANKNPPNSSETKTDEDTKIDAAATSTNQQNSATEASLRSGEGGPVLSHSVSGESSSSVGLDDYIRSPEVQNAIVERSPGGRYVRFMEKLGSGASKDVYRAYDTQEGIEVAWNVVSLTGVPKQERNRIVNEVRLLERLHHQNIISFHGSWVNRERQEVNFVTEILSSTLKSFIKKVQVIRWKIAKRWAVQILNGLDYLHSQDPPVIHRDLKCENIFINGTSGDLRIGDLGLSTVHRNGKVLSVLGTPEFMAPDMYEETSYDEKVDVYAFGMCLLEIFTKEIPYAECRNPAQIYKKVSSGEHPEVLSRLQSKHAREFVVLCLGHKNEEGKYIRPSVAKLLQHPFLMKRANDDDEVVVDPPICERTISEVSENISQHMSQQVRLQQASDPTPSGNTLKTEVPAHRRKVSTDSVDDAEGDTFENMQESEIVMNKVKVLMGRGQELEEDHQNPDRTPTSVSEAASQISPISSAVQYQHNTYVDTDLQTPSVLNHDTVSNQSRPVQPPNVDQQLLQTLGVVSVQISHAKDSPTQQSMSSSISQHNQQPVQQSTVLHQQSGQIQISPGKLLSQQIHSQVLATTNSTLQPPSNGQHQITRDPNAISSSAGHSNYLVAAAAFEHENPNIRPYANDILELVVTLPVDGQTQNVQFDFHLVEDDPVQVAKEMVLDLGIPQAAILEISETISGLARTARMKQDRHANRLKQSVAGQLHQQFNSAVLHPNPHVIGQTTGHDHTQYQQQTHNPNLQQIQHPSMTLNGMQQDHTSYPMNSNQPLQHPSMNTGSNSQTEAFVLQNSQSNSHSVGEHRGVVTGTASQAVYSSDHSTAAAFATQHAHRKSTGSAIDHSNFHHTRSQSIQQQHPLLAQNGNSQEQYAQQVPQYVPQGVVPVTMEQSHGYQQTTTDVNFFPQSVIPQQSTNGQQVLSKSSGLGSVYQFQSTAKVFSNSSNDYSSVSSVQSAAFEKAEQAPSQSISTDQLHPQISYQIPMNAEEVNRATVQHPIKSSGLDPNISPPINGPYTHHVAAGEMMTSGNGTVQQTQFHDQVYCSPQVGLYSQSTNSIDMTVGNSSVSGPNTIPVQQSYSRQHPSPFTQALSHQFDNGAVSIGYATKESISTVQPQSLHTGANGALHQQVSSAPVIANNDFATDPPNVQNQFDRENGSDFSQHTQQDTVPSVTHTSKQVASQGRNGIEQTASEQQVSNDSLLVADDEDIIDDEISDEMRKLEEEFQRNLQRANKVFINRMDNLQRSQIEREAQHQKTLERHQKERAEYEKRLAQEEEQQNRRIEQLQREWGKKKESIVLNKRKTQQNKNINGIHIQHSDSSTGQASVTTSELMPATDKQLDGTT